MSRARNVVQSMSYSPPKEDYDIDMIPLPGTGHTNYGYENTHHYEDPSKITPNPMLSQYGTRQKSNDLYEPTGPLQARKVFMSQPTDHPNNTKDSCLSRLVLFLILTVSVVALVLVALMITGYIGPSCLCSSQGPHQQKSSSSIVSIEPIMDELEVMKRNLSHMNTMMVKSESTVNELKTKLTLAWQAIDVLEAKLGQSNTSNLHMNIIQQLIDNAEKRFKTADNRMEKEIKSLHSKENDTTTFLFQAASDISALRRTMDLNNNKTYFLSSMVSGMNNTIYRLHDETINKVNTKTSELVNKDRVLQEKMQQLNSTLTEKIANVSKMAGPMGPRGFNGTQGPRGVMGINGSRGAPGLQGIQGPPGVGNLTLCEFKESTQKASPGKLARTSSFILEEANKRVTGVYCHSNRAALVNLDSTIKNGLRLYSCVCRGESSVVISSAFMECTISYWECPRTTK